ncbi:hypothetical protein HDU97_010457 [Phlyctochytrium planicorne]|nr:hypothetical protein HDU97_010457 [Phlyctochytrium planicorne]
MPPVHNLCSKISNAFRWKYNRIAVPESKTNKAVLQILYQEGLISSFSSGNVQGPHRTGVEMPATPDNISRRRLWLDLKYKNGEPVIRNIKAVSVPSRRVFASFVELKAIASAKRTGNVLLKPQEVGQITVLDTIYGILELKEALKKEVGGETKLPK